MKKASLKAKTNKILKVQNIPTNDKLFNSLLQTIKQFIIAYYHNEQ